MKAIAVWTMSKVVMFIFLILTFTSVVLFVNVLNERVVADSAQSVAIQIKSTMTAIISSDALDATLVVPLPGEIPERTRDIIETAQAPLHTYILLTRIYEENNQKYISWAISLGDDPDYTKNTYVAATWLALPIGTVQDYNLGGTDFFIANSKDHAIYMMQKVTDEDTGETAIYLKACDVKRNNCIGGIS